MLRSEPRPTPEDLAELERLDAAIAAAAGTPGAVSADDRGPRDRTSVADPAPPGADGPTAEDARTADALDRELLDLAVAVRASRPAMDPDVRARLGARVAAATETPRAAVGLRRDRRAASPPGVAGTPDRRRPAWLPGGARDAADVGAADARDLADPPRRRAIGRRRVLVALAVAAVAVPVGAVALRVADGTGADGGASQALSSDQAALPAPAEGRRTSATPNSDERSLGRLSSETGALRRESLPAPAVPGTSPSVGQAPLDAARQVVRDVEQTVRVDPDGVARAAGRVTAVVDDAGGYVGSSEVRERGVRAGASFEVVVPVGRLDATVAALSRVGRPVRLERSSTDVTDRAVALDDDLRDLRAERAAARLAMARTVDPDRREARRRVLTLLSSRVAALEGQRDALRRRTATATINLRLTTGGGEGAVAPAADDGRWGIGDAWRDAGRLLEVGGGAILVAAAVLLPLALLGGLVAAGRRAASGRRRARAIDAA